MGNLIEDEIFHFFNKEIGPKMEPPMLFIKPHEKSEDKLLAEYNISGTHDWTLCYAGTPNVPIGIIDGKSCSQNLFPTYTGIESLRNHRWSRLYLAQIQLYNFAKNYPKGGILFYSKGNIFYDWKLIEVEVDFAYMESILQKCKRVNQAVLDQDETLCPKINQPFWCKECRFEAFCIPELEVSGSSAQIGTTKEIDDMLAKLMEYKPFKLAYDKQLKLVKEHLVKGQDLISTNALVTWRKQTVNMPAKEAYTFEKHYPVFTDPGDV
jgi:hypothetical protein